MSYAEVEKRGLAEASDSRAEPEIHRATRWSAPRRLMIALAVGVAALIWSPAPWLRYQVVMWRVHARMDRGDMGYVTDATDWLEFLDNTSFDKVGLANRLLAEADGSLACEGMILAYRIKHPDLRRILEEHLSDGRWNWSLSYNNTIARQLLDFLDRRYERVERFVIDWVADWPR